MKFSFFESVKGKLKGVLCTWERFCNAIDSPKVAQIATQLYKRLFTQ